MPTVPLPDDPSLVQLRKQAKELRDATRSTLAEAQLALARRYGFASWPRLKHHLEVVDRYRRVPDVVPASADRADEFLRLACLRYGSDDGAPSWDEARRLLAEHPEIRGASIHTAAAVADVDAVRGFVAADPAAGARQGGPFGWEPLLYLAYARHDPAIARDAALATAQLLLDQGADPNAGYLWHGLPSPFTVLTGAFGEGEAGPDDQPRHPHALALAEALLAAGADANDGQSLYNRQFRPDDDHLVLLFAHGLGSGDGGPWRHRLGDAVDSPAGMVRRQLRWAVIHDLRDRVGLLVEHGVDVATPFADGRTPAGLAAVHGHRVVLDQLVAAGSAPPDLTPPDAFLAAALAGDRAGVDRLLAAHPGLLDQMRERRPGLAAWAAETHRPEAVRLVLDLGFAIDARGSADLPDERPWETALHVAVWRDDGDLVRLLLGLGADPTVEDHRFHSTPLGWAHHFGNTALVELLEPRESPESPGT
jgi:ankyrin repeat protein